MDELEIKDRLIELEYADGVILTLWERDFIKLISNLRRPLNSMQENIAARIVAKHME